MALAVVALLALGVQAEIPPADDDLSRAYEAALSDLRGGVDRQVIAKRLQPVVEQHPDSPWHELARELATDLANATSHPLAETRAVAELLLMTENAEPLERAIEEDPGDPAYQLMRGDPGIIAELEPLLEDRTPTRARNLEYLVSWNLPQPRLRDVARAIIEYHTDLRTRIEKAPIREKTPLARTLVRRARKQKNVDDEQFGLGVLREIVREERRTSVGAYAAEVLWELGDKSAVDVFYESLQEPGRLEPTVVFFLCRNGGPREWKLLDQIAPEACAKRIIR